MKAVHHGYGQSHNVLPLFIATFPDEFTERENQAARIVKGFETKSSLPYQLQLVTLNELKNGTKFWDQHCGGTLLTSKFAITARHCVDWHIGSMLRSHIKVKAGSYHVLSSWVSNNGLHHIIKQKKNKLNKSGRESILRTRVHDKKSV